jgi:hypothetical protein
MSGWRIKRKIETFNSKGHIFELFFPLFRFACVAFRFRTKRKMEFDPKLFFSAALWRGYEWFQIEEKFYFRKRVFGLLPDEKTIREDTSK